MNLLFNIALFLLGFLPAAGIGSMVLDAVLGDQAGASGWEIGWNPVLWFILVTPWLVPTVIVVPILQILGKRLAARSSRARARRVLLVLSPVLYSTAVLVIWGGGNFRPAFILPVAAAGVFYAALMRIPEGRPAPDSGPGGAV